MKRILRYVQVRKGYCLLFSAGKEAISSEQSTIKELKVYAEADFAGKIDRMKSTSSYDIRDPYGMTVNWRSRKQQTVAKSIADAEFNSAALVAEEGIWLQKVQTELYPPNYKKNEYPNIKL